MVKIDIPTLKQLHQERSRHNWHLASALAYHDYSLDLSAMDLSTIPDLRNVDFSGIDLRHTRFCGCKLSGANFIGATLTGASFRGANIIGLIKIASKQLESIIIDRSALPPMLRRKLAPA
jgi:hypothetical protein